MDGAAAGKSGDSTNEPRAAEDTMWMPFCRIKPNGGTGDDYTFNNILGIYKY